MSETRRRPLKERPLDAIQIIEWFWRLYPKELLEHRPESKWGSCQCGTEELIARSRGKPNQMRSFLLFSVFIDQMVYAHFSHVYSRFRERFLFPKLYHHLSPDMTSSSWLVYPNHGYDKQMDWEAARPVAKVLFVECLAYLQSELGVDGATDIFLEAAEEKVRDYWEGFEVHASQIIVEMIKEAVDEINRSVPDKLDNEDGQLSLNF